jgi:Rad3-related DNA helicase
MGRTFLAHPVSVPLQADRLFSFSNRPLLCQPHALSNRHSVVLASAALRPRSAAAYLVGIIRADIKVWQLSQSSAFKHDGPSLWSLCSSGS